jgi:hypothetical protein
MRCYLAGPMTGIAENNFPAFRDAAERLRNEGWEVISPVEMDEEDGYASDAQLGDVAYKDALGRDLRKIMDVEAIVFLPGWQNSKGAKTELSLARHYGLEIYYYQGFGRVSKGVTVGAGLFDDTTTYIESFGGARKGVKIARYDLIPPEALAELATAYGKGEVKYPSDSSGIPNYLQGGYSWKASFGALMRHAWRWFSGESVDPETGVHHLALVAWHCMTLMTYENRQLGSDDRL